MVDPRARWGASAFAVLLLAAACADDGGPTEAGQATTTEGRRESRSGRSETTTDTSEPRSTSPTSEPRASSEPGAPCADPAATLESPDGVRVDVVEYPVENRDADPWSQWGQGLVLPDGRFLSAAGDHLGRDGNAYLYEYDPATCELRQVGDLLETIGHEPGAWGYGKIHAALVAGPDGEVFVATYWGTLRRIEYGDGYDGDHLLRYDPDERTLEDLGVPLPRHGLPSLAGWAAGGLLYAEAADPSAENQADDQGAFVVIDMADGQVRSVFDDIPHVGMRSIAVGPDGTAYFSAGDGELWAYDPATDDVEEVSARLPGTFLRAATTPDADGVVYAASRNPDVLFALQPDGDIDELRPALGYTASLAIDPTGERLYYVPDAHGQAFEEGTPLMEVDIATGDQREVVLLNDLIEPTLDVRVGGSYDVAVSSDGRTVYVGLNGDDPDADDTFGRVVLAVVHL